jgi:hypothetical protein
MLFNSLIQQHNVKRLACHATMKVVSGGCLLLHGWVGCKGSLCGGVYRVSGSLESQPRFQVPYGTQYIRKNNKSSSSDHAQPNKALLE